MLRTLFYDRYILTSIKFVIRQKSKHAPNTKYTIPSPKRSKSPMRGIVYLTVRHKAIKKTERKEFPFDNYNLCKRQTK